MKTLLLTFLLLLPTHSFSDEPTDTPPTPVEAPACSSADGKDISTDSAAIVQAIKASDFCWEAMKLAENCGAGEALDVRYVAAAAPICQAEFEKHKPTAEDRTLLQSMRAACDGKWKNEVGGQYQSINSYCKLRAWQWMANLTSENGFNH